VKVEQSCINFVHQSYPITTVEVEQIGDWFNIGSFTDADAITQRYGKDKYPENLLSNDSLDFSFSGLKTAVALYFKKWNENESLRMGVTLADMAASFQESVIDVLVHKAMSAREKIGARAVVMAGGVACNNGLRARMREAALQKGARVYYPRSEYCTDNGAMIAVAGYHRILHAESADLSTDVRSKYPISDLLPLSYC